MLDRSIAVSSHGIPKMLITKFQQLLATIGLCILPFEVPGKGADEDDGDDLGAHGGRHTRDVCWRIFTAENGGTHNTTWSSAVSLMREADGGLRNMVLTDSTCTHQCGGAKGPFPLTADVVGLVGHNARHVGVGTGRGQKDTKVPDCAVGVKADNR